jgi:hypothetical protein
MEGERILSVIKTLHLLIDSMTDGDALTLIGYASNASILTEGAILNSGSRATLHKAADALKAEGGTNMSAAFMKLLTVHKNEKITPIDSVFVLTDGHINQGIVSADGLSRILTAGIPVGTPVYTLGYGSDHNSRLLSDIAVRTRGSYTYADVAELIPATIGDILGGLSSEVGRNARLTIPAGWRCLESALTEDTESYLMGSLIADKPQWVLLEGPIGSDIGDKRPAIEFCWYADETAHIEIFAISDSIPELDIVEQRDRVHVASVFDDVLKRMDLHDYMEAKNRLTALGTFLDNSAAKDRIFVIQMRAQVDDMLESVRSAILIHGPVQKKIDARTYSPRSPLSSPSVTHDREMDRIGARLNRFASNTAALRIQRGFISGTDPLPPSQKARAPATGLLHAFSSPTQRRISEGFTQSYAQPSDEL